MYSFDFVSELEKLAEYDCKTKTSRLFLRNWHEYEFWDDDHIVICLAYSVQHEIIHMCIDQVLDRTEYSFKDKRAEEAIVGRMIGNEGIPIGQTMMQHIKSEDYW